MSYLFRDIVDNFATEGLPGQQEPWEIEVAIICRLDDKALRFQCPANRILPEGPRSNSMNQDDDMRLRIFVALSGSRSRP